MAYETDSLNRRTLAPAIASVAVGIAVGVMTIFGVSSFTGQDSVPARDTETGQNASLLGGPEYGSRG